MHLLALALSLVLALAQAFDPAQAEPTRVETYVSGADAAYVEVETVAGTALTSTLPVTHRVGTKARPVTGVEALRLHPDCTAESSLLGDGTWSQGPGGLVIDDIPRFEGVMIAFAEATVTFAEGPPSLAGRCLNQ